MLKSEAWPQSPAAPRWRADARGFLTQARQRFVPSMRQQIDLPRLYAEALEMLPDSTDGQPPLSVPQTCPVMLDDLLAGVTALTI
jgi:hypothetical protein